MGRPPTGTIPRRAAQRALAYGALVRAGVLRPSRPDRSFRTLQALSQWGATAAAAAKTNAIRHPDAVGLVDDFGRLTFAEIHARTNALATGFRERGAGEGAGIAILCRNHRGYVESMIAASKLGARAIFLNTAFSPPQAREVLERERPRLLVHDAEFTEHAAAAAGITRLIADGEGDETLAELLAVCDEGELSPPAREGQAVILTSGTTGAPKGATRATPSGLHSLGGLFARVPYRVRETMVNAAPLFHTWGFGQLMFAGSLADTVVLQRRFDPEATLRAVDRHGAEVLVVVPVMLGRILALDAEVRARYDTSRLKIVFASGSALPTELTERWMDAFGDNLYNLYGSTEVAWATIATPADSRAAPGTTGRPPLGTDVRIFDNEGCELPAGKTGRIFVGSDMTFEGYTNGSTKEVSNGLMSTGDLGHLDAAGRLFVDSHEDDMIVSGGENVYPGEVEDLLQRHAAIDEAAVIGVADAEFGQVLKAFVVRAAGQGELSADDVRAHVRANLARFKVPKDVLFLPELPRNATGKVLKRALSEGDAVLSCGDL